MKEVQSISSWKNMYVPVHVMIPFSLYSYALSSSHPCVGDLHKAAGHLETFYRLALKHKWHTDNGDSLHEIACEHLRRVYTSIAEEVSAYYQNIHLQALLILTHEMAVPISRSPQHS